MFKRTSVTKRISFLVGSDRLSKTCSKRLIAEISPVKRTQLRPLQFRSTTFGSKDFVVHVASIINFGMKLGFWYLPTVIVK